DLVGQFASQFQGHDQHDSQEFLAFLLDAIHEDLNMARGRSAIKVEEPKDDEDTPDQIRQKLAWNYYRASNWSIVVDLFQGQLKSKLQCLTCKKTSTTFNPFMYLSVPIPSSSSTRGASVSLYDCLDKFTEPEALDGENAWQCPHCKAQRRTRKELALASLPSVLLVHLKRFYFQGPFKDKIETPVNFPVQGLDLTRYMPAYLQSVDAAAGANGAGAARGERFIYDLYAVSNHTGTLTSGHYTAHVLDGTRKQWHFFDDSRVTTCDESSLQTRSAYILFYHRRPGTRSTSLTTQDWWKDSR
ncbi:ubiquitin-specific protease doa4, partial [Cladochytrium tenue]